MRVDTLAYDLPDDRIARSPVEPRDSARLLVARRGEAVEHRRVAQLDTMVGPGDVVVLNNSRVRPARLRFARPTGGAGELLVLAPRGDGWWEALARPARRFADGTSVTVRLDDNSALVVEVGDDLGRGRRLIRCDRDLEKVLERFGDMPLPPYLGSMSLADPERYQTVYSERVGSAAAPTAGLHLTHELLGRLRDRGATVVTLELQVGLGTFRPMSAELVEHHEMHSEYFSIGADAWRQIEAADRVVAVGTTTVRALESAARGGALEGETDIFIRRGHHWRIVDALVTNFHLPRSSLLAMIDAFVGDRWRLLYEEALRGDYRFLSFGDAMWLDRDSARDHR